MVIKLTEQIIHGIFATEGVCVKLLLILSQCVSQKWVFTRYSFQAMQSPKVTAVILKILGLVKFRPFVSFHFSSAQPIKIFNCNAWLVFFYLCVAFFIVVLICLRALQFSLQPLSTSNEVSRTYRRKEFIGAMLIFE